MLPVHDITRPAVLSGQANGRLSSSILTTIAMPGGGTATVLAGATARCWTAMLAAAAAAGFRFHSEGSYRTYDQQVSLFRARYSRDPAYKGRPSRLWDSDGNGTAETWYLLPGMASAAVPGTSNHGLGLAIDLADTASGISAAAVTWLTAHAADYGISFELQSEPWHLRPYIGDTIPPAVLAYEEDDMTQADIDEIKARLAWIDGRVEAITAGYDTVRQGIVGAGTPVFPSQHLKAVEAKIDALTAAVAKLADPAPVTVQIEPAQLEPAMLDALRAALPALRVNLAE